MNATGWMVDDGTAPLVAGGAVISFIYFLFLHFSRA